VREIFAALVHERRREGTKFNAPSGEGQPALPEEVTGRDNSLSWFATSL
jgi:hypothetical protein